MINPRSLRLPTRISYLYDDEMEHLQLDEVQGEFRRQPTSIAKTRSIPLLIGCIPTSASFQSSYYDSTTPNNNLSEKIHKIIGLHRSNRFILSPKMRADEEEADEMTSFMNSRSYPNELAPLRMALTPPVSLTPPITAAPTAAASIPIVETREEVSLVESKEIAAAISSFSSSFSTKESYERWYIAPFFRCPMLASISSSSSSSSFSASLFSASLSSESYSSVSVSSSGKTDSITTLTTPTDQTDSITFTLEECKSSHSTQDSTSLVGWSLTATRQLRRLARR